MGKLRYPEATRLLITADSGGSNGARVRLWKVELQKFANETGLEVQVSHLPPGTSKWNKIGNYSASVMNFGCLPSNKRRNASDAVTPCFRQVDK